MRQLVRLLLLALSTVGAYYLFLFLYPKLNEYYHSQFATVLAMVFTMAVVFIFGSIILGRRR